jgi:methylamine dehydrogenase accessory protein MauD
VFLVAAIAKMRGQKGFREALGDFGVSARLAQPLAVLIPLLELAVGATLVAPAVAPYGEIGAFLLLLGFFGAVSSALAHERQPNCHCFGQFESARTGWITLARIALLATITSWLMSQRLHGRTRYAWFGVPPILFLCAWIMRNVSKPPQTQPVVIGQGLPIDALAPEFSLPDLDGRRHSLASLSAAGKPVLLLFTDPGCEPCKGVFPVLVEQAGPLQVVVVSRGTAGENRETIAAHGFDTVLLQHDAEVAEAYDCPGGPAAVLISPDGRIQSGLAMGAVAIQQLLAKPVTARS